jgi:hypothetical protein
MDFNPRCFTMWQVESERRYVELAPGKPDSVNFWATWYSAVKDDGTRVSESGGGREGEEFFTYKDADMSFKFKASRFDGNQKLTSVYTIHLEPHLPKDTTLEKARAVASNIRQALLILPPSRVRHHGQPPTAVIFDMVFWDEWHPDAPIGTNFP